MYFLFTCVNGKIVLVVMSSKGTKVKTKGSGRRGNGWKMGLLAGGAG
jgi:hypothetical protein